MLEYKQKEYFNIISNKIEKNEQNHLNYKDTINLGSYYTPKKITESVFNLLLKNNINYNNYKILDTSCGYGSFLEHSNNSIGADCDINAVQKATKHNPNAKIYHHNSLKNIDRTQYNIKDNDKIIIVGNPPYNDTTSIIRQNIKTEIEDIDGDVKTRDLGMSFLLSYDKLQADYMCVLHPLSYLIKKANFQLLSNFAKNYKLIDSVIISSSEFSQTSKTTQFPIIIGLYKRGQSMNYGDILNYTFKTDDNKIFAINQFDKISNYITKYPNQKYFLQEKTIAFFWTMRDINALKRTKTFIATENVNTIRVSLENLHYYCYIDIFKEYIKNIPYYFGNCDVFINNDDFLKIKDIFIDKSLSKYDFLSHLIAKPNKNYDLIDKYFKKLIGEHYVY